MTPSLMGCDVRGKLHGVSKIAGSTRMWTLGFKSRLPNDRWSSAVKPKAVTYPLSSPRIMRLSPAMT